VIRYDTGESHQVIQVSKEVTSSFNWKLARPLSKDIRGEIPISCSPGFLGFDECTRRQNFGVQT
jgi:hypothetical protein